MNKWANKYKKHDWRYWYDTPKRYAQLEIEKVQKCNRNYHSYGDISNIDLMGAIFKMYNLIYSGHRKKALNIWEVIDYQYRCNLPKWLVRYFGKI